MRTSVLGMILAGGEGTRLAPLTDQRAKPAVPYLVDVVSAEDGDEIGLEVFDQRHVLVNCIGGSAIPCAVLGLHLRGNRDDEAAADLGGRYVPAVDDVFHQTL